MKSNRRDFIRVAGLAGAGLMVGCSLKKPEKTLADIKSAYFRESTTEDKYNHYAQKAKEDNFPKISVMLTAIAKAEGIHAANHKKVLDQLKGKYEGSPIGSYKVQTTLDNLKDGFQSEDYEVVTMYPSFIKEANDENVTAAVKSFTWAWKAEIQHKGYYSLAISAAGMENESTFPGKWYVCPTCGATYSLFDVKNTCDNDATPKEQFLEFK